MISENPCDGEGWYIDGKTLKIVPKFDDDSFALSFAYKVDIFEVSENWDRNFTHYTQYLTIPPYKKNQFKIPAFKDNGYVKAIKKKYYFRDTSITGNSESGPFHYRFTRNKKVFNDQWNQLYLRIKRFNNGKLIEIKHIAVGLTEGCD